MELLPQMVPSHLLVPAGPHFHPRFGEPRQCSVAYAHLWLPDSRRDSILSKHFPESAFLAKHCSKPFMVAY